MKAVAVLPTQLMLSSRKTSILMNVRGRGVLVKNCFARSELQLGLASFPLGLPKFHSHRSALELCDGEGYLHGDGGVRQ